MAFWFTPGSASVGHGPGDLQKPGLQTSRSRALGRRIVPVVPVGSSSSGRITGKSSRGFCWRSSAAGTWLLGAGQDLYRDLIADASVDRDVAKRVVNAIINGGRPGPGMTGKLAEFVKVTETYRISVAADAKERGYVQTLAGRKILLAADDWNHGGKAVNRVVQGTSADIFNRAAVAVDRAISEQRVPAAVSFLLFDELWVEAEPADERIVPLIRDEVEAAALTDGVYVPVKFDESMPSERRQGV